MPARKITVEQALTIAARYRNDPSTSFGTLAKEYGTSRPVMSNIVHGRGSYSEDVQITYGERACDMCERTVYSLVDFEDKTICWGCLSRAMNRARNRGASETLLSHLKHGRRKDGT